MKNSHLISIRNKVNGALETYDIRTGDLVQTNGIVTQNGFTYTVQTAEAICNLVAEGYSLSRISEMKGMPSSSVMYRWRELHPEFRNRLKAARAVRAEVYRDKAEQILEDTIDKDEVPVNKFKFDGYMRLAEKDAPEMYGTSAQLNTGQGMSLKLVVNTGIVRDEATIEGECYETTNDESDCGQPDSADTGGQLRGDGGEADRDSDEGVHEGRESEGDGQGEASDRGDGEGGDDEEWKF